MNKVVLTFILFIGFNTASGKYHCNIEAGTEVSFCNYYVSIPQAVGTIAILQESRV